MVSDVFRMKEPLNWFWNFSHVIVEPICPEEEDGFGITV